MDVCFVLKIWDCRVTLAVKSSVYMYLITFQHETKNSKYNPNSKVSALTQEWLKSGSYVYKKMAACVLSQLFLHLSSPLHPAHNTSNRRPPALLSLFLLCLCSASFHGLSQRPVAAVQLTSPFPKNSAPSLPRCEHPVSLPLSLCSEAERGQRDSEGSLLCHSPAQKCPKNRMYLYSL